MIRIILIVFFSWFAAIGIMHTCFVEPEPARASIVDGSDLAKIEKCDDYSEIDIPLCRRKSKAKSSNATKTSQDGSFTLIIYDHFLSGPSPCIGFDFSYFTRAQRGPPAICRIFTLRKLIIGHST